MLYLKTIGILLLSMFIGALVFAGGIYIGIKGLNPLIDNKNALNLIISQAAFLPAILASILTARALLKLKIISVHKKNDLDYREYLMCIVGVASLFCLSQAISLLFYDDSNWMKKIFSGNDLSIGLASLIALIFAPLNEEILMRGLGIFAVQFSVAHFIGRKLSEQYVTAINWGAILITSTLFAALHIKQYSFHSLLYIFGLGIYFGYLRIKTKSITVPIFAHFIASAIGLTAYFTFEAN